MSQQVEGKDKINRLHVPVTMQVEVAFWDTAGQERFHSLAPLYYRDADAALLVSGLIDPPFIFSCSARLRSQWHVAARGGAAEAQPCHPVRQMLLYLSVCDSASIRHADHTL